MDILVLLLIGTSAVRTDGGNLILLTTAVVDTFVVSGVTYTVTAVTLNGSGYVTSITASDGEDTPTILNLTIVSDYGPTPDPNEEGGAGSGSGAFVFPTAGVGDPQLLLRLPEGRERRKRRRRLGP